MDARKVVAVMVLALLGGALLWWGSRNGANPGVEVQATFTGETGEAVPTYEIVTLLPADAIPAIYHPEILSAEEAAEQYAPDEMVLGVEINGEARAYSIPYLSNHEIANDELGGVPIAVTW